MTPAAEYDRVVSVVSKVAASARQRSVLIVANRTAATPALLAEVRRSPTPAESVAM